MAQLYTIGCSIHKIENFLSLLKQCQVNCLVDVRSVPYSAYTPQFNRENLSPQLKVVKIFYLHMGENFGAQRQEKGLYSRDEKGFYVDFAKVAQAGIFLAGMERIRNGLAKGYNIALMCTEKDPMDCHRAILVARNFALAGIDVKHILADGSLLEQKDLDSRLVRRYNKEDDGAIDMFDGLVSENTINNYNLVADAYRHRGMEIAFRKEVL